MSRTKNPISARRGPRNSQRRVPPYRANIPTDLGGYRIPKMADGKWYVCESGYHRNHLNLNEAIICVRVRREAESRLPTVSA
jgi:hypothetical protein